VGGDVFGGGVGWGSVVFLFFYFCGVTSVGGEDRENDLHHPHSSPRGCAAQGF
jgi:hypothetical protein